MSTPSAAPPYLGFDRNDYPGDAILDTFRKHFDFVGYWITNPPGETKNTWSGKRTILLSHGFGFLVLANGRLDAEILAQQKRFKKSPAALGKEDAQAAIASATHEGFPPHTILFLDQEEGGRLLPEQAAYFFAWTETVAASTYRPGSYLSGQPSDDGPGQTITTAADIQQQIAAKHLHPITLFVYQDACPPSNGCTLTPPPVTASGTPGAEIWQYAQSPRRPEVTHACAKTFARDGNCYLPGSSPTDKSLNTLHLDLSVATSSDPSKGR